MADMELIATSTMGLESVVAGELENLGYQPEIVQTGRILFRGDCRAICRANLWLRTAGRVLVRLGEFEAVDFGRLFDKTYALPWQEWIPPDGAFPVNGRSLKSQLSSVPACQKIVKKAVANKLLAAHRVTTLGETGPPFTVDVTLLKDRATVTLDTSGSGLHRRGYRRLVGKAPLRETLAAGLVLLSYWNPQRPLVDPFCGSGTIPIEAAMIGRNIAPGLNRPFAAEAWPTVPARLWLEVREEARDLIRPKLAERIIGTDIDEEALKLARYHAQQAQVAADIHFQRRPFAELRSTREYGCLITNPPYAERMGRESEVQALRASMPEVFRRLKTWSFYVLTAGADFEELLGQPADRRRKLYNSRIECTYYQFFGPKPPATDRPAVSREMPDDRSRVAVVEPASAAAAPAQPRRADAVAPRAARNDTGKRTAVRIRQAFGGLSEKSLQQAELFRSRLTKRAHHLRRWPTRQGITCYRLYDRDIPEIPLIVDRYEDCLHVAEYERPHSHTPAEHADWLDLMKRTAAETLEVTLANTFLKQRRRQRGESQYERLGDEQRTCLVREGGLRFEANLSDYLDTGLFLDHRITRGLVRDAAAGRRFLNLFAYTGSFTVYAAAGGATSTTTVDRSNTYLEWARRNMTLNQFAGHEHCFVRDDAMHFLRTHPRRPSYDLAVVDPPTFSNSKMAEDFFDIQRDHVELLNRLLELMTPGGIVFFSSNFRRFKLADADLRGATIREISRQTVPPDFRNTRIHRAWRIIRAV